MAYQLQILLQWMAGDTFVTVTRIKEKGVLLHAAIKWGGNPVGSVLWILLFDAILFQILIGWGKFG